MISTRSPLLSLCLLLVVVASLPASANAQEPDVEKAWRRNWKNMPRWKNLQLGGMNTSKAARAALPFWLGQTGIVARMDRKQLLYTVTAVTDGSPSAGKVRVGDVIVGCNGKLFVRTKGYPDFVGPNVQMGNAILDSWGSREGRLTLSIKRADKNETIELSLPGRGSFGRTFPKDDALSDALVRAGCELLVARQLPSGAWDKGALGPRRQASHYTTAMATLALLATGDKRWRRAAKRGVEWMVAEPPPKSFDTWHYAYLSIVLGEYYMLTGHRSVRPALQKCADVLSEGQFDYFGSGHASYTGNYRGRGISICTTHALLGMAYAKLGGAKVPTEALKQTLAHIERISPKGGVPYVIWGKTAAALKAPASNDPNPRNEHAGRTGTALLAFRLLGGSDAHQRRMANFLAKNSDYMDNGHASGNTLGWMWGSLGLAIGDEAAFAEHMQRRRWWLALKWRHDAGTMLQPAECINFRSSDGSFGPHGDVACQVLVLAAPRRALLATGRVDPRLPKPDGRKSRLVSLARWDHHHGRLRRLDMIPALLGKKTPRELGRLRASIARLDPDRASDWDKSMERIHRRELPALCRALQKATKDPEVARSCILLATALRPTLTIKPDKDGLKIQVVVEQIPYGKVSVSAAIGRDGQGGKLLIGEPPPKKGRAMGTAMGTGEGVVEGTSLDRRKHVACTLKLNFKGGVPALVDLPLKLKLTWNGIELMFNYRTQNGLGVHKFGYRPQQPLVRVPGKLVAWANEGALVQVGDLDRLTVGCNAVGFRNGGAWELLPRKKREQNFPAGSRVWLSLYDLGYHKPFIHEIAHRR